MGALRLRSLSRVEAATVSATLLAEGLIADLDDGVWIGLVDRDRVVGTARILERDGAAMLDDVWVANPHRRRGLAGMLVAEAKARRRPLWLICDEDMVGYYLQRGFDARAAADFPAGLAALYAEKGEWPGREHTHFAMCWDPAFPAEQPDR